MNAVIHLWGQPVATNYEPDELRWYALDVMRQREYVAGLMLSRRGCVTYIPTETHTRRRSRYARNKIEVAQPIIPGVVFCGFPGQPEWFHIMRIHLVNGVLSLDGQPRRFDTAGKDWLDFRAHNLDGFMRIERHEVETPIGKVQRSVPVIEVQGKGVIRTHASVKTEAGRNRPVVRSGVIRTVTPNAKMLALLGPMLDKATGIAVEQAA